MSKRIEVFELKEKLDFLQTNRVPQCVGGYGATQIAFYEKVGIRARTIRDCLDPTNGKVGLNREHQRKFAECCKFALNWVEWIDPEAGVEGHERQDTAQKFIKRYLQEHGAKNNYRATHPEETSGDPVKDAPARLVDDLKHIIRKTPDVLRYLKRQRGMEALPLLKSAEDEKAQDLAVRYLLAAGIDDQINAHYKAFLAISKERSAKNADQLEDALIHLAQRLVPALYRSDSIAKIKSALGQNTSGLVLLSIYRPAVAEVAVAAAEECAASYLPRQDQNEWPIGERNFPEQAPDSGFDSSNERLDDLKRQLSEPFSVSGAESLYETFRSFMAGSSYFRPAKATDFSLDFKYKMACDHVKFLMDEDGRRFYMTFPLPETEHDRKALRDMVTTLENDIQGMLFLALDTAEATVETENKRFRPFIRMLPVQAEGKSA